MRLLPLLLTASFCATPILAQQGFTDQQRAELRQIIRSEIRAAMGQSHGPRVPMVHPHFRDSGHGDLFRRMADSRGGHGHHGNGHRGHHGEGQCPHPIPHHGKGHGGHGAHHRGHEGRPQISFGAPHEVDLSRLNEIFGGKMEHHLFSEIAPGEEGGKTFVLKLLVDGNGIECEQHCEEEECEERCEECEEGAESECCEEAEECEGHEGRPQIPFGAPHEVDLSRLNEIFGGKMEHHLFSEIAPGEEGVKTFVLKLRADGNGIECEQHCEENECEECCEECEEGAESEGCEGKECEEAQECEEHCEKREEEHHQEIRGTIMRKPIFMKKISRSIDAAKTAEIAALEREIAELEAELEETVRLASESRAAEGTAPVRKIHRIIERVR